MTEWIYEFKGDKLRKATESGCPFESLIQLRKLLEEIIATINDLEIKDTLQDMYELTVSETIDGQAALIQFMKEENYNVKLDEMVNERLDEFYSICDDSKIWLGL